MAEQYVNDYESTLNGAINDSATTVTVTDAAGLPSTGDFRIIIGSEIMRVTARSGTQLTVERGSEGTVKASHADSETVRAAITKGSLDVVRKDIFLTGAYASKPSAGQAGRVYLPTDAPIILRDDGASWKPFGPCNRFKRPSLSGLTWVNQGTSTATENAGGIDVVPQAAAGVYDWRILKQAAPATPWTLTCAFIGIATPAVPKGFFGVCVRESDSDPNPGRLNIWYKGVDNAAFPPKQHRAFRHFSDPATILSGPTYSQFGTGGFGPLHWLRLTDDGTDLIAEASMDGVFWAEFGSTPRTSYPSGSMVPSELGVCFSYESGSFKARLLHYEAT